MSAVVAVRQRLGAGLGASEIAAALGLSRWKAPITLWLEKTGRQKPTPANEPAEWGIKLEPIIRAEYVERHGVEVRIPRASEYHPDLPWARATVDGYVYAPDEHGDLVRSHLVEVKAPGLRMADDWGDADEPEVPDYYYVQAVWQMFVTGLRRHVDFAVLLGGQSYFERTVHHDADLEAEIVNGATEFMRLVESDTPPGVDASDAHARYLRSLIKHNDKPIEAPADVDAMATRWRDIVRDVKLLEDEEALLKNRLLARCVELGASKLKTSVGQIAVTAPGAKTKRDYEGLARDFANRLQLHGEVVDFDAELAKRTTSTPTDGSLRRSNNWTKETK